MISIPIPQYACVCPTASGGPMLVPECRIHAGPFGRETVKLRAEVKRLEAENAEHRRTIRAYVEAAQRNGDTP